MALSDEPEELLDLVDSHDIVVGTVVREEVARLGMALPGMVRASNVFIVDGRGRLWVPRRSPHKKSAPNGLDYSAGEHVQAGETYAQAIIRGMKEELNLDAGEPQLELLAKISNAPVGLPYFNTIYLYRSDDVPHYNTNDFVSYEWLTPAELQAKLAAGEPAKKDMELAVAALLDAKK
ncbi:MAG TPA: NUDIX domain-containing protein [Candidatus Saccharimonadales bacterium]|nr:NUDIX domain-containing protein [Candidatus Saccharimonadales bacterium]